MGGPNVDLKEEKKECGRRTKVRVRHGHARLLNPSASAGKVLAVTRALDFDRVTFWKSGLLGTSESLVIELQRLIGLDRYLVTWLLWLCSALTYITAPLVCGSSKQQDWTLEQDLKAGLSTTTAELFFHDVALRKTENGSANAYGVCVALHVAHCALNLYATTPMQAVEKLMEYEKQFKAAFEGCSQGLLHCTAALANFRENWPDGVRERLRDEYEGFARRRWADLAPFVDSRHFGAVHAAQKAVSKSAGKEITDCRLASSCKDCRYFLKTTAANTNYACMANGAVTELLAWEKVGDLESACFPIAVSLSADLHVTLVFQKLFPDPLDVEAVIEAVGPVLARMHKRGVAHGDLHDGNLMFDRSSNRVRLVDLNSSVLYWRKVGCMKVARGNSSSHLMKAVTRVRPQFVWTYQRCGLHLAHQSVRPPELFLNPRCKRRLCVSPYSAESADWYMLAAVVANIQADEKSCALEHCLAQLAGLECSDDCFCQQKRSTPTRLSVALPQALLVRSADRTMFCCGLDHDYKNVLAKVCACSDSAAPPSPTTKKTQ